MTKSSTQSYKLESDINDFVKAKLTSLGLEKLKDFNEESAMSDYLKEAIFISKVIAFPLLSKIN